MKSMGKKLVILTDKYPYGTGETFIENERPFWNVFNHVYLCPVIVSSMNSLRSGFRCKENETLITVTREQYKKSDAATTLVSNGWGRKIFAEIRSLSGSDKRTKKNAVTVASYAVRSHQRAKLIGDELKKYLDGNDDIAVYAYWFLEPALVGIEIAERYNAKLLFARAHRYDLYEERHVNTFLPFRKLLLETYDKVCPISTDGKNYILDHYGKQYNHKTCVKRLGTIRLYDPKGEAENKSDAITIVSCSAISEVKRVHLIVNALMREKREIHWVHFGDGELRRDIEQLIEMLPPNVKVALKGFVENKDVQKYYSENIIAAFINVSSSEGVPVSIMEAQSYGLPVIATDVGGTAELVHHKQNGVLLRTDFSSDELIDALNLVLDNYEQYRSEALRTWECMSNAETIYRDFFYKVIEEIS